MAKSIVEIIHVVTLTVCSPKIRQSIRYAPCSIIIEVFRAVLIKLVFGYLLFANLIVITTMILDGDLAELCLLEIMI